MITERRVKQLEASAVEAKQSGGSCKPEKSVARLRQTNYRFRRSFLEAPEIVADM